MTAPPEPSARAYIREIISLLEQIERGCLESICLAGAVVARTVQAGRRVWVAPTTYTLHEEATGRAGGFIAVHALTDTALVAPGDCVLVGSPVGTSVKPIAITDESHARGAHVIALTNREFEEHADTILEDPSGRRLHEIADLLVDIPGPLGDGTFDLPEFGIRVMPHSGVTGVAVLWMIFSEALSILRRDGTPPLLYQCVNIRGARERNAEPLRKYLQTGLGYEGSR